MKKRVMGRMIALILTLSMLASMVTLPAIAADIADETEIYAQEDFNAARDDDETLDLDSVAFESVHPYVGLYEKEEDETDIYAIVPFRGDRNEGNWDQAFRLSHRALSAEEDQGVFLEFDIFLMYFPPEDWDEETDPPTPTVEIQLEGITHDPNSAGKTKSSYIPLMQIDLSTGDVKNTNFGSKVSGVAGITPGEWNTVKIEFDLLAGTFSTYINGKQYAVFGKLSTGEAVKNVNISRNSVLLAKCNKGEDVYIDDDSYYDTEISHIGLDNVVMYHNDDYRIPEEEPVVPYAIFSDTFESKQEGQKPGQFGYKSSPSTARVVLDPLNSSNNAVRVDMTGKAPYPYYLWHSANSLLEPIENAVLENGRVTGTVNGGGMIAGDLHGDTDDEKGTRPSSEATGALPSTTSSGKWYVVTGAWADAMRGAGNVASGLNPAHPALLSAANETIVLNVSYYFSPDSVGSIEIQMQGGIRTPDLDAEGNPRIDSEGNVIMKTNDGVWIDTINVNAKRGVDRLEITNGGNYNKVCGTAPAIDKGEWFTMSVVFNMKTGYEDIYFNGSYSFTLKPKSSYSIGSATYEEGSFEFYKIIANSLNTGKIKRSTYTTNLAGYFLVDDINFSTAEVLQGETYNKKEIWNFNDIMTDDEVGFFSDNIPATVKLTDEGKVGNEHTSALRLDMGEALFNPNRPVLWSKSEYFAGKAAVSVDPDSIVRNAAGAPISLSLVGSSVVYTGNKGKFDIGDPNFKGYELGTYADYVNYWGKTTVLKSYGAATSSVTNLNRDWAFYNTGISYATKEKLAIDLELYISADAAGVLQGRIKKGVGLPSGSLDGRGEFTDLVLYTVDVTTGNVYIGDGVDTTPAGKLDRGAWNALTLVINMKTGAIDVYANHVLDDENGSGTLPYSQLAFYESTLVPVLISTRQPALTGYILLDDLRFLTVSKELVTVDSKLENIEKITFKGVSIEDPACKVHEGSRIFVTDDTPYVEKKYDTESYRGIVKSAYSDNVKHTIRLGEYPGLRFCTAIDTNLLEAITKEYGTGVAFGTLIVPATALETVTSFTRTDLQRSGIEFFEVRTRGYYQDTYYDSETEEVLDGVKVFAGSLVGLEPDETTGKLSDQVDVVYAAVGYVEVYLKDGSGSVVIYSDMVQTSLAYEAQKYLDRVDGISDEDRVTLTAYARKLLPE